MKVIGAGLFRTGTLSLRQFFEDNGFSPSYHGSQAIISYDQEFWAKCFDESNQDAIVKFMKERGYLSTSDAPACFAVKELSDAFPDAKIILGIRDSPKAWVKSFQNTVLQHALEGFYTNIFYLSPKPACIYAVSYYRKFFTGWIREGVEKGNSAAPDDEKLTGEIDRFWEWSASDWEQFYINWIRYVKTVIPKERLLVFNVKEGVKPLEKFLDLDLPEEYSMPFVHESAQYERMLKTIRFFSFVSIFAWSSLLTGAVLQNKTLFILGAAVKGTILFICSCVNKNTNMNTEGFKFTDLLPKFQ